MPLRRAAAFAIDAVGFAALAYVVCRGLDRSVKADFPPHQAALAARRIVPALGVLYGAWAVAPVLAWRASVGKKLLGLRVLATDGGELSALAVVLRETALKWLSLAMNGAGLVDGLATGRAFHDRLVGSVVVASDDDGFESADDDWAPVTWPAVGGLGAVTAFMFWSMKTQGLVFHVFRQGAFYVPHEAGHLVVGAVLPHLVGVAAGAWGQLLFPSIAAVVFARRRWPVQLAGTLVWLALSLFDIAAYASDAWYRDLAMPVAVGDEFSEDHLDAHDWWQMLGAAGVLRYAQPIGGAIAALGWVAIGVGLGGLAWLAARSASSKSATL